MVFVPVAEDAIDAQEFEIFLAEGFQLLGRVQFAAGAPRFVAPTY